jgi:hypothetical protein
VRALVGLIGICHALGCGAGPEVILHTAAGVEATAQDVDRNPLWLLPAGGIGWFHLELDLAKQSELGRLVLADLRARFPLPEAAGFSLERDVRQLSVATYSMQGLDFAGVVSGHFDVARITAAAAEYRGGPLAPTLARSEYAGRTLFTSAGIGFAVITEATALFGNDVGVRRCLDRIAEARVADDLPSWVKDLLATPNATFSIGVDLKANALTASLPSRLAALQGAAMVRGVGNFDAPGINLAGTISHADHDAARGSAARLLQAGGSLNIYGRLLGLGQPIQKLETQAVGNDTRIVLAVDRAAVELVMKRFLPPPPVPTQHVGPGWAGHPRALVPSQLSLWSSP